MSTEMQTKVQASPAQNFMPAQTGLLQRKTDLCNTPGLVEDSGRDKEKLTLQRSSVDQAGTTTVPPIVHGALRSSGQPLDTKTRALMEPRFGHDFSKVRVHTDAQAAESARAVNALAYTVGTDIVFDTGRYVPETESGSHLLAHELVHVSQQSSRAAAYTPNLTIDSASSADEWAAEATAARVVRGEAVTVHPSVTTHGAQRLQRKEHGTYVSTQGDPTYLDAGFQFYKTWGHPNVRRVSTMEDVLNNLDRARGTIDTFRIVSHGSSMGLDLGLLPDVSPSLFDATAAEFTTEQRFRQQFTGMVLLNDAFFTRVLNALRADAGTGPMLNILNVGAADPTPESSIGILLRAILETLFLANVQLDTGGAPRIANLGALNRFNLSRITTYSRLVVNNAAPADRRAARRVIRQLSATEVSRVMAASQIDFPTITQAEADILADPFTEPAGRRRRLLPEISKSIEEGGGGPYLRRLRSVRGKINVNTHVEIRGCNIGNTPSFLDELRGFFGNAGALPSISAPDLYQYFFKLNFQTFELRNPDEVTRLETEFNDPDTGLAQGLEDARRILGGEMTRVVNDTKLSDLSARYGHNQARLRNLNPEIDPDNLITGQAIWLIQRTEVQAGRYRDLGDLCRDYLGDQHAWPNVWAANTHIQNAAQLNQNDRITLPANLLTPPVATPDPTFADLEVRLRAGGAVAGINAGQNRPSLTLQNIGRARALADWLAAQQFDPRGRTAATLSRLYAGRRFARQAANTYIQFLSGGYPTIEDPIFPEDPRYQHHIIRRP